MMKYLILPAAFVAGFLFLPVSAYACDPQLALGLGLAVVEDVVPVIRSRGVFRAPLRVGRGPIRIAGRAPIVRRGPIRAPIVRRGPLLGLRGGRVGRLPGRGRAAFVGRGLPGRGRGVGVGRGGRGAGRGPLGGLRGGAGRGRR